MIPGRKFFQLRLYISASPLLGKLYFKADWGRRDFESWEGDLVSKSWWKALGALALSCPCKPIPWKQKPSCALHGPGKHLCFLLIEFIIFYAHVLLWLCYARSSPYCMLPKDRDHMFCSHHKPALGTGLLLRFGCWMCETALVPRLRLQAHKGATGTEGKDRTNMWSPVLDTYTSSHLKRNEKLRATLWRTWCHLNFTVEKKFPPLSAETGTWPEIWQTPGLLFFPSNPPLPTMNYVSSTLLRLRILGELVGTGTRIASGVSAVWDAGSEPVGGPRPLL